jgi:hypothetical protein
MYLSLLLVHFIIEFFAYMRGYGLSMAFLTASIYYLICFSNQLRYRYFIEFVVFSLLAALANLALLNSILVAQFLIWLILYLKTRVEAALARKVAVAQLLLVLPVLILLLKYSFMLRANGSLYYGSLDGFWDTSVVSLSKVLFRNAPFVFRIAVLFTSLMAVAILVVAFVKKQVILQQQMHKLVIPTLLTGNIVFTLTLSFVLRVNYPEDRVGMYFYLLFVGTIAFVSEWSQRWFKYTLFVILPFIVVQFFASFNPYFSSYYPEYQIPKSFYKYITNQNSNSIFPYTVEGYHMYRAQWAYNNLHLDNRAGVLQYAGYPTHTSDYLIADKPGSLVYDSLYQEVAADAHSDLVLLKRVPELHYLPIAAADSTLNLATEQEYYDMINLTKSSVAGKSLRFNVSVTMSSAVQPFPLVLIVKAVDSSGKEVQVSIANTDQCFKNWNVQNGKQMNESICLPHLPLNTDKVSVFLMNPGKVSFHLYHFKVKVFEIRDPI